MKELGLHPAGAYNMLADMLEDQHHKKRDKEKVICIKNLIPMD